MIHMKHPIIIFIIVLLCSCVAFAWTPPGDIDLRNYYEIVNGTNISTTNFYQDGNAVLDNTSAIDATYSSHAINYD